MSDFRKRLLGLAAVASAFAGVSYGQVLTCGAITANTVSPTLRAESQTELVSDTTTTCTLDAGTTVGTVFARLNLAVTSKAITFPASVTSGVPAVATTGNSEAVLHVLVGAVEQPGSPYFGTVSGNQVSFGNVTLTAGPNILVVQNIRVNAATPAATTATESLNVNYQTAGVTSNAANTGLAANVGTVLATLGTTSLSLIPCGGGASGTQTFFNYTTCTGNVLGTALVASNTSFTVAVKDLLGGSFKTILQEAGSFTGPVGVGAATTATQILVTLGNIPSSATVYVPQSVTVGGTTLNIANSTTATSPASVNGLVPLTPANNVVAITYTVTAGANSAPATYPIPVIVGFGANTATAQGPITVLTSYAPTGALTQPATVVPTFAASTATAINASTITLCQTSLLFPFVTNAQGFDTGLVISNTSTDNLGLAGKSVASAQAGTCSLSFYGTGLPTPSTGVNDPQGNIPTAATHAFLLSQVAPGFQGYMIANCPFLYAHGFAFLASGLGQPSGVVQGYLAEVLTPGRVAGPNQEATSF
jgi:hypothetical protein